MLNRWWLALLGVILTLTILTTSGWAQSAGSTAASVTGRIADEQSAVVEGALVIAKNLQTNQSRETVVNSDGTYTLNQLSPGNYELVVKKDGFATTTTPVELVLGATALINLTLKVGTATDVIEVVAEDIVDATRTESSTNIQRNSIDNLPINRRNFLDFSLTAARVLPDRVPTQGASATSGLSFNGQTARFNNVTIDGLDNNDFGSGSVRSTYSQDAVQEFQIISDNYSAEFGKALGGIVNIVTRSGGNSYHGDLFLFNRNDSISARDAFATVKPPFSQYQFGASLNGPIKKDRAFFFGSFERLSVSQSNIVTISDDVVKSIRREGFTINNGPVPFSAATSTALFRGDIKLTNNDNLWLRYNFGGSYNGALEPFGGLIGETNAGIQKLKDNTFAANNLYINSGLSLINETRFLYTRRDQDVLPVDDSPNVGIQAPEGLVTFGRSAFLPQGRLIDIFQFVNNATVQRGNNQLKVGIDYEYFHTIGNKTKLPLFSNGLAFFLPIDFSMITQMPGLPTFSALETFDPSLRSPQQRAFLNLASQAFPVLFPGFPRNVPLADLSLPVIYGQLFGDPTIQDQGHVFSAFAQDDYKVRPNLLIKLGLRYDLSRSALLPDNNGNFSPRISFSYSPSKLPRLRVKGAYGLFYGGPLIGQSFIIKLLGNKSLVPLTLPLPFSIIPFAQPGHALPPGKQVPSGLNSVPQFSKGFVFAPKLRNSYTQQTSLGLDYILGSNTLVSLDYVFVRGLRLVSPRNINPIVRPNPNPVVAAVTGRIDTSQGDVSEFESAFDSYYHAFTLGVNRRLTHNFSLLAHYTFSKTIDNFIDFRPDIQETVNPLNIGQERGLSLQDVRHRLVISGTYDLNYIKNPLLTGFQLSTILSLSGARPYNLLAGTDLNGDGDNLPGDRPLVGGASIGRNTGITPGLINFDLRLSRTVKIKEHYQIQGLVEVFNLFNRTNINDINRIFPPDAQGNFNLPKKSNGRFVASPDRYRSAFSPRQLQIGLRLSF